MSKAEYQALLARGIGAAGAGDAPRARMLLRAALERDPEGIDAWLWLAQTAESPSDALACLRRVLDIAPDHARARQAFQQLLLREGIAAAKAQAKHRARGLLRELCRFAPTDERAWLWRASVAERYDEAVECLARVLEIHPGHVQAQTALDRLRQRAAMRAARPEPAREDVRHATAPASAAPPVHASGPEAAAAPPRPAALPLPPDRAAGTESHPAPAISLSPAAPIQPSGLRGDDDRASGSPAELRLLVSRPKSLAGGHVSEEERAAVPTSPERQTAGAPAPSPAPAGSHGPLVPIVGTTAEPAAAVPTSAQPGLVPDRAASHEVHPVAAGTQAASAAARPAGGPQTQPAVEPRSVPAISGAGPSATVGRSDERLPEVEPPPGTVLVVDDSPTVLKVVTFALRRHGLDVVTASSGAEALAQLDSLLPDLVLLDVNMPGMDGYQVCRAIRRDVRTSRIPVVMLSGKDGFFDRIRGRMAGAVEYITKPFEPVELMAMLGKYFPVRLSTDERADISPEPAPWSHRVLGRNV